MQAAGEVEPAGELNPAGHGVQEEDEPPVEKVASGQLAHEPKERYWPALQLADAGQALDELIVPPLQAAVELPE